MRYKTESFAHKDMLSPIMALHGQYQESDARGYELTAAGGAPPIAVLVLLRLVAVPGDLFSLASPPGTLLGTLVRLLIGLAPLCACSL